MNVDIERLMATLAFLGIASTLQAGSATWKANPVDNQRKECVDDWNPTSLRDVPAIRSDHTAVWTGSKMIVWGGYGGASPHDLNTGGQYDPNTDNWIDTSTINAPEARNFHTAIWTGSEMIVWGGAVFDGSSSRYLNSGGRYNPATDSWTTTSTLNAPSPRHGHTAVWTGSEMIVWGGQDSNRQFNTGARYDPATDSWTPTNRTNAPTARSSQGVWTGNEMIVWGGADNTGGRYNPSTDSWTDTSTINAPEARGGYTTVWTGSEMIVWGGSNDDYFNTGGRYNPNTDSWLATSLSNAPSARRLHTAVWTGSEMIVWGGYFFDCCFEYFNTGGRYNPATDSWTATGMTNAPNGRFNHTSVWTDSEMIIWGGETNLRLNTGASYCPQPEPTITLGARVRRQGGNRLVVLTWSPADGGNVNVLRDGVVIDTTDDDGETRDRLRNHTGTFSYKVCETDSGDCSNEVEVNVSETDD